MGLAKRIERNNLSGKDFEGNQMDWLGELLNEKADRENKLKKLNENKGKIVSGLYIDFENFGSGVALYPLSTGSGKTFTFFNGEKEEREAKSIAQKNKGLSIKSKKRLKKINFVTVPFYSHLVGNEHSEKFLKKYRNSRTAVIYGRSLFFPQRSDGDVVSTYEKIIEHNKTLFRDAATYLDIHYWENKARDENPNKKYKETPKEKYCSPKDGKRKLFFDYDLKDKDSVDNKDKPLFLSGYNKEYYKKNNVNMNDTEEWIGFCKSVRYFGGSLMAMELSYERVLKARIEKSNNLEDCEDDLRIKLNNHNRKLENLANNTYVFFDKFKDMFWKIYNGDSEKDNRFKLEVEYLLKIIEKTNPLYLIEFFDNLIFTMVNAKATTRLGRIVKKIDKDSGGIKYKFEPFEGSDIFEALCATGNGKNVFCNNYQNAHIAVFIDESEEFQKELLDKLCQDKEFNFILPDFYSDFIKHTGLTAYYNDEKTQFLYDFLYVKKHSRKTVARKIAEKIKNYEWDYEKSISYLEQAVKNKDTTVEEAKKAVKFFFKKVNKDDVDGFLATLVLIDDLNSKLKKLGLIEIKSIFKKDNYLKKIIKMHKEHNIKDLRVETDEYRKDIKRVFNQIFYKQDVSLFITKSEDLKNLKCVFRHDNADFIDITSKARENETSFTVYEYLMTFLLFGILIKSKMRYYDKVMSKINKKIKDEDISKEQSRNLRFKNDKMLMIIRDLVKMEFKDKKTPTFLSNMKDIKNTDSLAFNFDDLANAKEGEDNRIERNGELSFDEKFVFEDTKLFLRLKDSNNYKETKNPNYTHLKLTLSSAKKSPEYSIIEPLLIPENERLFASYNLYLVSATGSWRNDYISQFSTEYIKKMGERYEFEVNLKEGSEQNKSLNNAITKLNNSRKDLKEKVEIINLEEAFLKENNDSKEIDELVALTKNELEKENIAFAFNSYKKKEIRNIFQAISLIGNDDNNLSSALFYIQSTFNVRKILDYIAKFNELSKATTSSNKQNDELLNGQYDDHVEISGVGSFFNIDFHRDYKEFHDKYNASNKNSKNRIYTYKDDRGYEYTIILYHSKIDTDFESSRSSETPTFKDCFLTKKHDKHKIVIIGDYTNITKGLSFKIGVKEFDKSKNEYIDVSYDFDSIFYLMDRFYVKYTEAEKQENGMLELLIKMRYALANNVEYNYTLDNIEEIGNTDMYNLFRDKMNKTAFLKDIIQSNGRAERTDRNNETKIYVCKETLHRSIIAYNSLKEDANYELSIVSPLNQFYFDKVKELIEEGRMSKSDCEFYSAQCEVMSKRFSNGMSDILQRQKVMREDRNYDENIIDVWSILRGSKLWPNSNEKGKKTRNFNEYIKSLELLKEDYPALYESIMFVNRHSQEELIKNNFDKLNYFASKDQEDENICFHSYPTDISHFSTDYNLNNFLRVTKIGELKNVNKEAADLIKPYLDVVDQIQDGDVRFSAYFIQSVLAGSFLESLALGYFNQFKDGNMLEGDMRFKYDTEYNYGKDEEEFIGVLNKFEIKNDEKNEKEFYKEYPQLLELFDIYLEDSRGHMYCIDTKNWSDRYNQQEAIKDNNFASQATAEKLPSKDKILKETFGENGYSIMFLNLIDDDFKETETYKKLKGTDSKNVKFSSHFLLKKVRKNNGDYKVYLNSSLLSEINDNYINSI